MYNLVSLVRMRYCVRPSKKSDLSKEKRKRKRQRSAAPTWQLQAAKARFSEVVRRARAEGPQVITKQGKEEVVVLPVEDYRRLANRSEQPKSIVQFLAESPLAEWKLDLERAPDYGRTVEL